MRSPRSSRAPLVALATLTLAATLAVAAVPTAGGPLNPTAVAAQAEPFIAVPDLQPVPERMWGVSGIEPAETQTASLDVLVWDMVQIGDRMFVGGAFLNVQEDKDTTPIRQSFVAAFDIATGEWIDTWRPTIDRAVYALENFNGVLLVGGEFESVNGVARTGLVGLDPISGAIDPTFSGYVERPWSELRAGVRDIAVHDNDVYVVGNFSHLVGAWDVRTRVYKAARLTGPRGEVDASWKPEVTGSGVWGADVNRAGTEVYLVGYFTAVNGEPSTGYFHTVNTNSGASVPGKIEIPRNYPPAQPEFFDVTYGDDTVFVAGEQHIVQVLAENNQDMLGFHTTGQRTDEFEWNGGFAGGAYQAAEQIGEWVVAGCHCTYSERNGLISHYSSFSDQRTPHRLLMVYHADSGDLYEPFEADVNSPRDGSWAFTGDTHGCLWAGGDFHVGGVDNNRSRWLGGFARFCPTGFNPDGEPDGGSDPEPGADVIVPAGASWRYDDSGRDLGTAWRQPSYDDGDWSTGTAEFGFGDGDETTSWTAGSITYYARTGFDFDGPQPPSLALSLKADDGAVVYLNGVELMRDNMGDGTITASTPADDWKSGADETFVEYTVPADALRQGANVVAVEVHNVWDGNADLSFDLQLASSSDDPPVADGPLVPANATWRMIDDATAAPAGWPGHLADAPTGTAPIGFGDDHLATQVTPGNTTYYFTRTFEVDDPDSIDGLTLGLLVDDGAVVFINRQQVFRRNIAPGPFDHDTQASTWVSGSAERTMIDVPIPADSLVEGTNVVAVEVHNVWAGNSDLGFDLSLDSR